MSEVKGKVGEYEFIWKTIPRGPSGSAEVEVVSGPASATVKLPCTMRVSWRRDESGIWIEVPYGAYGFDVSTEVNDDGIAQYLIARRGSFGRWAGLSFQRAGEQGAVAAGANVKKSVRVRAQMPGKILKILVEPGAKVEKEQPLMVMEAMKMENEIRATQAGVVTQVKVTPGQAVETGADLCLIDPA